MKRILTSKLSFYLIAAFLIWMKSYLVYQFEFNLDLKNQMQQFLLLFNPISSAILLLGIALFFNGKRFGFAILTIYFFMSLFLYANIVFYRFNSDFITLPLLTLTNNFGSLGESVLQLIAWKDIVYFFDFLFLIFLYQKVKQNWKLPKYRPVTILSIYAIGILAFTFNLHLAESDRPELLERTFDRNYIVKYLGIYNFMVYDIYQSIETSTQRVLADSNDITEVANYTNYKYAKPNPELFGVGERKNIIKIHLESFQTFLIDFELHGEEVTPFINSLVRNPEFTFFENFFHQTEQGKTADAELMLDTSLYGLPQGAAFVTKGTNTYQSLPAILSQRQGYTNAVFHGDSKSFWNRDEIYKRLAIDYYFDESYYDMRGENVINYGLKDKPFFEESIPYLKALDEPFYAHLMTLTHHHPFLIEEEEATIEPAETNSGTVNRYFQTARYLDEALEQFFADLKKEGLYEDSIIIIYGDHYGISDNHNEAMEQLFGEEITPFKYAQLQRVPFFIRIPGVEGKGVVREYAGQIDVMPTLLHLLGIDSIDYIVFGTDMFSENHSEVVPFRNGDFISPEVSMIHDIFYDQKTGEEIEANEELERLKEAVQYELELSDKVLYGDLLRFYTPTEDWVPVNPSDYFYGNK